MVLADGHDVFRDHPFLVEARADYETHVNLARSDPAAFKGWLDSLVARFVAEELSRASRTDYQPLAGQRDTAGPKVLSFSTYLLAGFSQRF